MPDDLTLARAVHVLAVVHWIGGVTFVTTVLLPTVRRDVEPARRIAVFEALEHRFARQARLSVPLAGLSGFWLTHRLAGWPRLFDPALFSSCWWMHAMVAVWVVFMGVLFVAEPLFLHAWFQRRAAAAAATTFTLIQRAHGVLLTASLVTVSAAVLGAHGFFH